MGKAARWIKGLLGMKREKEQIENSVPDQKEKKRWSFAKSAKDSSSPNHVLGNIPVNIPVKDPTFARSYLSDTEKQQNKQAIAVAAATAAAADAAVAAAQAAVAVVRLTSNGRGTLLNGGRERRAAMKIQTFFRGYLARKALRALKALVKLQALVRGYLVRKRAAATLHSMQALIRAQAAVRTRRARRSISKERKFGRTSLERFDETRSEFHSRRISTSYESPYSMFDESPKIVEIDTYKPTLRSRRINVALSECGEDLTYQTISSPLPHQVPGRHYIPQCRNCQEFDWCFTGSECRYSTAHNTPRFANAVRCNAPPTPSKSVCGDAYFRPYSHHPNYMANTQSFKAKLRSLSAPKQRPEAGSKKRLSLNEMMAARNSVSGVRMQRSCSQFQGTRII